MFQNKYHRLMIPHKLTNLRTTEYILLLFYYISFQVTNRFAGIGRQLGLWIGVSFLTCCEALVLLLQLITLGYSKLITTKNKNGTGSLTCISCNIE